MKWPQRRQRMVKTQKRIRARAKMTGIVRKLFLKF